MIDSNMDEYVYVNPVEIGYKKFKLTRKNHNLLFKHRQMKWYNKYEYYYNENNIIIHKFATIPYIILCTLLLPVAIFISGYSDVMYDLKRLYNQKKSGSFTSDNVWKYPDNPEFYNKIIDKIKN